MNETDLELLARYSRDHFEDAFTEIVRRHLDLVFSAAYRQVRSRELAQEVAQSVFMDLARQAQRLSPHTILTAWLYQVTRRTAIDVVRREARRQSRELHATEMNAPDAKSNEWASIEPLLEEAMDTLGEKDRAAVLLRYFENKSLREVGRRLGVSEDAARKRVDRAVERLGQSLARRGVPVGASGLASIIAANAVQAAPQGLLTIVSAAAVPIGTLLPSTAFTAAKTVAMTAMQKTLITAAVLITTAVGIYEAHQASAARSESQRLRQAQAQLLQQTEQLQRERDSAANRAAAALGDVERMRRDYAQILRLRGELGRVSTELRQLKTTGSNSANELSAEVNGWIERGNSFKQWFKEHPERSIPELQLLWNEDWVFEARSNPTIATNRTEGNTIEMIASSLRQRAKSRLAGILGHALSLYVSSNNGQLPGSLTQLLAYMPEQGDKAITENPVSSPQPVDSSMLARYELRFTGPISNVPPGQPIVMEKEPVDRQVETSLLIKADGFCYDSVGIIDMMAGTLNHWAGQDSDRLKPFLK